MLALVCLSFLAPVLHAQPAYSLVDPGLFGMTGETFARGVDGNGALLASALPEGTDAAVWEASTNWVRIPPLGGGTSFRALATAGQGFVFGQSLGDRLEAARWTSGEGTVRLRSLAEWTSAIAVGGNRFGVSTGVAQIGVSVARAVLWRSPEDVVDLGEGGGRGVNAQGQVVGVYATNGGLQTRSFVWTEATGRVDLPSLPGATRSYVTAIGDGGLIVGYAQGLSNPSNAWAYTPDGRLLNLESAFGEGGYTPNGVNGDGVVVGAYRSPLRPGTAFRWTEGEGMVDLQALLDASGQGYTLQQAVGVNDQGQIAATALYEGQARAVLLNPVPEPATLTVLAALAALSLRRRSR